MRFIINGDGTVTDTDTGLMWQQETDLRMPWDDAISYCKNLALAGYADWRMPNIEELLSIVDYERINPAIDVDAFPNTLSSDYWSSTTFAYLSGYAWYVNFGSGYGSSHGKSNAYYVRAVRSVNAKEETK